MNIYDTGATGNKVQSCYIGTDAPGTAALPNGGRGVALSGQSNAITENCSSSSQQSWTVLPRQVSISCAPQLTETACFRKATRMTTQATVILRSRVMELSGSSQTAIGAQRECTHDRHRGGCTLEHE